MELVIPSVSRSDTCPPPPRGGFPAPKIAVLLSPTPSQTPPKGVLYGGRGTFPPRSLGSLLCSPHPPTSSFNGGKKYPSSSCCFSELTSPSGHQADGPFWVPFFPPFLPLRTRTRSTFRGSPDRQLGIGTFVLVPFLLALFPPGPTH